MRANLPTLAGTILSIAALVSLAACGNGTGTIGTTGGTTDTLRTARTQVVAAINQFRATLSLPALAESTTTESCADTEAAADAAANTPHSTFTQCGESAQNECPDWPALAQLATGCVPAMWNEGPGTDYSTHGEYTNMVSTGYTKVAVGVTITSSGAVWSVVNFAP
jgi:uncharacterized protein YkwD